MQKTIESVCSNGHPYTDYSQRKDRLDQCIAKVKKFINKLTKGIDKGAYIVCVVDFDDCDEICFYLREINNAPPKIDQIHLGFRICTYPKWSSSNTIKINLFLDKNGEHEIGFNTFDQKDVIYQFEHIID